ncbi:MAG: MFS transporter [Oscillospiraceae bacterium]|nr:MFS transporter [Oscillospiraceae bacterium]
MKRNETGAVNVFSVRNFRLVFFGALASELGAVLYSFAVSFYILEKSGNNAFLQGLYLALCGVMLLIFTPIGGVLGDRWNKAKIMFVCDYIKGGLILFATLMMYILRESGAHIAILFAVGMAGNAVSGIFNPASGALLPYIVEEQRLQQANAYFSIKNALQSILGIMLAGILYAALPVHLLFIIVGVCYVLSGVSEMFIRYEHRQKEEKLSLRIAVADMGEGVRYLKTQKPIMAIMAAALFINFFMTPIAGNFIPYFVRTDIASSPSYLLKKVLTPEMWSSAFSMLIGISSLVGSIILSAKAQDEKCGFKIAQRLCAVALSMIALTAGYYFLVDRGASLNAFLILFCLGCLFIGLMVTFVNIPINTALMRIVDKDKLSKVSSILSIISQGLIPIASALAGAVLQGLGSAALLAVCSAGFTLTAVFLLLSKQARKI